MSVNGKPPGADDFDEEHIYLVQRRDVLLEQIADQRQYRTLRQHAFIGVAGLIAVLAMLFIVWTASFGVRLFIYGGKFDSVSAAMILTPIGVMAALVAVPLLAMIRFVFRRVNDEDKDDEEENGDTVSIWQTVLKELAEIFKTYLTRSRPAA